MSDATSPDTWWGRAGGGREVLKVAMPLVVTSLSWTILTFVDRVFLKWHSGAAMAAAFSAAAVWFSLACLPLGICGYVTTFVAQYHGNHQTAPIGKVVWHGVWIALIAAPAALAAVPFGPLLFSLAGHVEEVRNYEIRYFQILCSGLPAMWICQALSAFYGGRGLTWVTMWIDGAFAAVNGVLDYLWIFGHGGFPAMGVDGAAWATSVSLWLKTLVLLVLFLRRGNREQFQTWTGLSWDKELLRRILRYGGPSGMQMLLEVAGFTLFVLLVGRLGSVEAEATSMAFSISTLAFMPVWGVAMAASILVGQHLGDNRDDLAERSTWTALAAALAYTTTVSLWYVLAPDTLLAFFFWGEQDATATDVQAMARRLLRYVAAYNLLDAVMMVMVSAIKGAGDTRYVLWVSLALATALSGLTWLGVAVLQLGIYANWTLITLWIWVAGVVYWRRFRLGAWKNMRVIETKDSAA